MKLIPLTQGQFAQVDDEDYNYLNQFNWQVRKIGYTYYASRHIKRISKTKIIDIFMHRDIMECTKTQMIDHIDRNGLNNQKINLRYCTYSENQMNKRNFGKVKYKGVSLCNFKSEKGKYRAMIRLNHKLIHLGYFINAIDAAHAYDIKAKDLFGEFANLNFK